MTEFRDVPSTTRVVVVPKGRQGQVLRDARVTVEKAEHRARIDKTLRDNGFLD